VVLVADISLKNSEYIKTLFLESQAAYSNLEYATTFTPNDTTTAIQGFYNSFCTLFNCTRYLIKKNLISDLNITIETNDIAEQNKIVDDTSKWFQVSTIDKVNITNGKRLFKEYSWLVVNNLF
jgi:hypothetical protein